MPFHWPWISCTNGPFRTPLVPLAPILGVAFCLYLMASLPGVTWLRFFVWMAAGLVIYFSYGRFHSRLALKPADTTKSRDLQESVKAGTDESEGSRA